MKKLLLVVIVTGLMSMSAMAGWVRNTTIAEIHVTNASVRVVFANPSGGNFGPKTLYGTTADDAKNMMATALTAKSTGATVDVYLNATTFSKLYLK